MTHTRLVRITHWVNTAAFVALVVSGMAILLAHPRFYWGETGAFGSPALLGLPLAVNLDQSGWGRSLHFLAAWICVANGAPYVARGLMNGHFAATMLGKTGTRGLLRGADPTGLLREARPTGAADGYNRLQRSAYVAVVFVLFPLVILTGLAMSPAVMAAVPIVDLFGGHQSARTMHGAIATLLLLFLLGHVIMVLRAGVGVRMRGMILG